jgi:mannose-1-phosphate guanylyltransferase
VTTLKALILAGGFATRLRPLSCSRPKTLFPIVNKPLLQWIFERLADNGVDEAILAVNALTQFYIRQHKPSKCGLRVRFSVDPPKRPLGTGGPLKKAEKLIGHDEPFIMLNGDIYADINYTELLEIHRKTGAVATIALCKVDDPSSFGVADLQGCLIRRFVEKPDRKHAPSNLINAGAYILSPEIFQYIPDSRAVSLEREVFPKLAEEGKLCGHCTNGLWIDIGKPQEYLEANKIVLDAISKNAKQEEPKASYILKNPVALDESVSVGKKSVIGPYAIIGKNVKVGDNVKISNSVIFAEAQIADGSILNEAIVGEGAKIGKNVKLPKGCIIGDLANVKDRVHMHDGTVICPAKEVTETF